MNRDAKKQEIDLKEYWRIIMKRKWLAATFAGAIMFFTAVFSFLARPTYKATVTLLIEEQTSRILSVDEAFSYQPRVLEDLRFFNTQRQLLKSKSLVRRVATKLNLLSNPEFVGNVSGKRKEARSKKEKEKIKGLPPSDPYSGIVDMILSGLDVVPVRETKLLKVSYVHGSPILATEVVNTLAEEFINFSIEKRSAHTQQATDFLREQIVALREEMAAKERELQKYGQEKELVFLSDTESAAVKKFADLNDAYTDAQRERIKAETEFRALKDFESDAFLQFISDPNTQQLKAEYSRIKTEYEEKSKIFKPDYPEMVRLKARLDSLMSQINQAVNAAEARYRTALAQENSYRNLLERQKSDVANMKNNAILYESLKIEVEAIRKRYNNLLEKEKELDVSSKLGGISAGNISIIDKAEIPKNPVSPKKKQNLILAFLVGIFGGAGLCFLFEYLDDTVKGPEDTQRLSGLPSLGIIPYVPLNQKKGARRAWLLGQRYSYGKERSGNDELAQEIKKFELINHYHPDIPIAEDYRTVRTSILLSHEIPPKTILITSPMAQEGKSTTVANLAVSFSQLGEKVLIMDADLRKSRLHRVFDVRNIKGLSGVLTGQYSMKEAIQKTSVENIWLVPGGPIPPNPSELLNSKKMKDVLSEVGQLFDIVFLDSPPVLAVIDPVIVAALADGTVIVVQAGKTSRKPFLNAVEELNRARAKILGVVFNQARTEDGEYLKHYRYYRYQYLEEEKGN